MVLAGLTALALACGGGDDTPAGQDPRLETVATGLTLPWALGFMPDGRILVTEKPGRIRVIEDGNLRSEPWATLDVWWKPITAAGLMGMALAPDFEESRHVFVVGTFRNADTLVNRVIRLRDEGGRGVDPVMIVDSMPSGITHAGAQLAFGPDGMLYVTSGELMHPEMSQDLNTTGSKILRYRPDGSIPDDNPWPGSPVYVLGTRNVQGIDWHPETGEMFASEHGPTGFEYEKGWKDEDEFDLIIAGENYGWPLVSGLRSGLVDDPRFVPPLIDWTPAIAPSGMAFYSGDWKPWYGNAFVACLRGQQVRRVVLEPSAESPQGWRIVREEALFEGQLGRIRTVVMGRDGYLYITTNNRRGRRAPDNEEDDRVLRLVPFQETPGDDIAAGR
jgi:glucose/arabinose dehydrogenase